MANAILVQCFNKADTLDGLCESLLRCRRTDEFDLIFWSDSPEGSRKVDLYRPKNLEVLAYVDAFAARHAERFASVTIRQNDRNLGTCMTCRVALDAAFEAHDFAVFTEDDTVFAPDALDWFLRVRDAGVLDVPAAIAIAGESIFFDSRRTTASPEHVAEAREVALERGYLNDYTTFTFLPSTCFATTREKWCEFRELRGQPRGDEDVCAFCREQNRHCVFPVVPRVKDIGMLHADGYSVAIHGIANVPEVKNVYLTSADLIGEPGTETFTPRPFAGNADSLFKESVLLKGFTRRGRSGG